MNHNDFIKALRGKYSINGITIEKMDCASDYFQVLKDKKIIKKHMSLEYALCLCVKLFKEPKK